MSERETFTRTVAAELAADGDGRTIEARIAPYGAAAEVADPPEFKPYNEMFVPGAFEAQTRAAGRLKIWLNFEHDQGLRGIVGHGATLEERSDGLYGTFRVHENADGDKALQLIRDGLLTGLSLEFAALRSRVVNGVVQRLRAHIDKVSLCRFPAYSDAQILAVRTAPLEQVPPAEEPAEELLERLAALGVERLQHRAVTRKPWDGSPARFTDDQYKRATLFCRGGDAPPKQDCSLPVLEPNGDLNVNALGAAAAALAGGRGGLANVTGAQKATAARKLIRYYRQAGMEPPASLVAMAGR
jgi:HK97 family phage prohead protease